jgi:K+-transporting ATPase ATPase C chain
MSSHIRAGVMLFVLLTLLTGVVYPMLVTLVGQTIFPHQANGSILTRNGKPVGSDLIGQHFEDSHYFWGRPSATELAAYNAASSSGSNQGPTSPDHLKAVKEQVEAIRTAHPDQTGPVPGDLAMASGSGLDPHISMAAAEYQVARVAQARGLSEARVRQLIAEHTEGRTLGLLGEPRVKVLQLNLALDQASSNR